MTQIPTGFVCPGGAGLGGPCWAAAAMACDLSWLPDMSQSPCPRPEPSAFPVSLGHPADRVGELVVALVLAGLPSEHSPPVPSQGSLGVQRLPSQPLLPARLCGLSMWDFTFHLARLLVFPKRWPHSSQGKPWRAGGGDGGTAGSSSCQVGLSPPPIPPPTPVPCGRPSAHDSSAAAPGSWRGARHPRTSLLSPFSWHCPISTLSHPQPGSRWGLGGRVSGLCGPHP